MNNKQSSSAPKTTETVESILAPISSEQVSTIPDSLVRQELDNIAKLAEGILKAVLTSQDSSQRLIATSLGEVNIGEDDGRQLVADGEVLRDLYRDRQAKEASLRAATSKLEAARARVHQQFQSYASIMRGQFGAQSSALEQFGIKKIGGAANRKRALAKKSTGNDPTPAK